MFTGIIEGLGKITGIRTAGEGKRLSIDADFSLDRNPKSATALLSTAPV